MRHIKRMLWVIPVGFIGLGLLGQGLMAIGVIPETPDTKPATEVTQKATPKPTVTKTAKPVPTKSVNPISQLKGRVIGKLGKDRNVKVSMYKDTVQVGFDMDDNLFSDSRIRRGHQDILSILQVVKDLKITNRVFVEAWFPLIDKYGNKDKYSVLYVEVSNQTLNKMNLDNLKYVPENLEYIAEEYYLHPAMLK